MECWKFDCLELPAVPGGYRAGLTSGIAKYLGIAFDRAGNARERAMQQYPQAFCRLVRACANEARAMMREGVAPFDEAKDERETVATKDGIRIRERRKSYPALKRLVRLLSANFTNPETVLRLEYERGDTDAGFEDGDDVGCLPRGDAGDRGDGAQRGSL